MVEPRDRHAALIAPRKGREDELSALLLDRFGLTVPGMSAYTEQGGMVLARTAPHQFLAMRDEPGLAQALQAALGEAAGVIDLSDARSGLMLSGPRARDVLSGLAPVDLHPSAMHAGRCVQTVMAHMTVLVLQLDDAPSYEVYCPTSYQGSLKRAFDLAG